MQAEPPNKVGSIILASSSNYRKQQLQQLNLQFSCERPDIDESPLANEEMQATAIRLASQKAHAVAAKHRDEQIIIGADQTAELHGSILGKPHSIENAIAQLEQCSGQEVIFYSGICVLNSVTNLCLKTTVTTVVKFRSLSKQQIRHYIDRDSPLDCAGSFKCEGLGIALFESIESRDPTALIGLPLITLTDMLLQMGVDPLSY
ncbi:MAG: septum formation protein [Lentisphaeria bacterium]|jgi:septum formation protein